ncbi:MAG TPA: YwiC-like family protein [Candidatus Corynebacterium avicola]|uniref:YwiC-like family protein n=1 Tax=Candidatus Corynebacterium avicola TaxID=2838527 RepID=A0A9D1RNX7_9CORY|nr:YwiC-like family protein [Candidatus Corynebacterium avicola]
MSKKAKQASGSKAAKGSKKHGTNPWKPNQHGAWPMIVIPVIVGVFWMLKVWDTLLPVDRGDGLRGTAGMWLAYLAVTVAWVVGYHAFFAAGIWMKARNATLKKASRTPMLVYGAIAGVAAVIALLLQPHLLWWVFVFGPLIAIAVYETWRGTPRSLLSGVATTAASTFIVPVGATIGLGASRPVSGGVTWTSNLFTTDVVEAVPSAVWVTVFWLLLYTVGTVPYVKTMIRKKGDQAWLIGSQVFHLVALIAVLATFPVRHLHWAAWLVAVVAFAVALWRSRAVPASAAAGNPWPPKKVGVREAPLHAAVAVACLMAALLYDGPLMLFI